MTENIEKKSENTEQNKAKLKTKLQNKINQKKVGRMNNKQREQQVDSFMKKMGITPDQSNQMKEMFHKLSKKM